MAASDRDLLFGLLALQNGLVEQGQLVAAFQAWVRDRSRPLADHLVDRGDLEADARAGLELLVALHVKKHGDVETSLAAMPAAQSTREELAGLGDTFLEATLSRVGSALAPTQPAADRNGQVGDGPAVSAGQRFKILRLHARGGLGAVYVARDGELNRDVALKQILDGYADDPTSRTRFLLEAEITGGLEHPGIVPIYGLGSYGNGRPYYAMRFIRGDSLKDEIDAFHNDATLKADPGHRSLALRKLLRRFVDICNAIGYAHTRGVLHRDIKPANVIVGKHGETLVVDWGLAKVLGQAEPGTDVGLRTLMTPSGSGSAETLPGSAMGTPGYMSPEQADGDLDRIGPRSDVFSLGATLYNILSGRAPYGGDDLGAVLRAVRLGEFPRPRQVDASVDPALEAICLKAMSVTPGDRYASCRALAEEIERWAADEPVSARRDPITVRLGRWARKHRVGVAIGAGLLQTAVVALTLSTVLLGQSRARVERERKRAEAVNSFLVKDLLAQADPDNNPAGSKITVRELLDKAAAEADASPALKQNPDIEGSIRSAIGNTYYNLGLYDEARTQLERAVACQDRARDLPTAERFFTLNRLIWVIYKQGHDTLASDMATKAFAEATTKLGREHEETVYAADSLAAMTVNGAAFRPFEIYRENLAIQRRVLGPDHLLTLRAAVNFASALTRYGRGEDPANLAEGLALYQSHRDAFRRTLGPDHPETFWEEVGLGFTLARSGKYAEARDVLAPLHERAIKIFGPDSLNYAQSCEFLALAEEGLGNLQTAEALLVETLAIRERNLKKGHSQTLQALAHLARVSLAQGKPRETARYSEEIARFGGKGQRFQIANDPSTPKPPPKPEDVDALEAVFSGRVDPSFSPNLLATLNAQLAWLAWKNDWFRNDVLCLWGETWCLRSPTAENFAEVHSSGISFMQDAVKLLEANPSTPPRILEEARTRLARSRDLSKSPTPTAPRTAVGTP